MFRMISMIYKHLWDNYMKLFNNLFYLLIFQRWSVTPERKKSRSEDLDKILESFWPERSDARERLSERQQAFFVLTTDQRKVKGERALSLITVWHENVLSTEVMSRDTNNNNNNTTSWCFCQMGETCSWTQRRCTVKEFLGASGMRTGVSRRHRNELHEVPEKQNNNNRLRKMVD